MGYVLAGDAGWSCFAPLCGYKVSRWLCQWLIWLMGRPFAGVIFSPIGVFGIVGMLSSVAVDCEPCQSLKSFFEELLWRASLKSFFEELLWRASLKSFFEELLWRASLKSFFEELLWRACCQAWERAQLSNWFKFAWLAGVWFFSYIVGMKRKQSEWTTAPAVMKIPMFGGWL